MSALKSDDFLSTFHQRYIVEVSGHSVGLVVQERRGFRFFASADEVAPLNRLLFTSPRRAEDACRALLNGLRRGQAGAWGRLRDPAIPTRGERDPSSMIGG